MVTEVTATVPLREVGSFKFEIVSPYSFEYTVINLGLVMEHARREIRERVVVDGYTFRGAVIWA